jgi:hypothetical protein
MLATQDKRPTQGSFFVELKPVLQCSDKEDGQFLNLGVL